jgi:hypothetical protein
MRSATQLRRSLHSGAMPEVHWLDARFPRLRVWLESQAHRAWLRSVAALLPRAAPQAALAGQQQLILSALELQYARLLAAHSPRVPADDARAQGHVSAACRVLATHLALLPFSRDSEALTALIREQAGMASSPLLRFITASALVFAPRPHALGLATLRALRADYGQAGFQFAAAGEEQDSLVITRCLYWEIFKEEGLPGLACATCCSLDSASWFGARPSAVLKVLRPSAAAVRVRLDSSLAKGEGACLLRVVSSTETDR